MAARVSCSSSSSSGGNAAAAKVRVAASAATAKPSSLLLRQPQAKSPSFLARSSKPPLRLSSGVVCASSKSSGDKVEVRVGEVGKRSPWPLQRVQRSASSRRGAPKNSDRSKCSFSAAAFPHSSRKLSETNLFHPRCTSHRETRADIKMTIGDGRRGASFRPATGDRKKKLTAAVAQQEKKNSTRNLKPTADLPRLRRAPLLCPARPRVGGPHGLRRRRLDLRQRQRE